MGRVQDRELLGHNPKIRWPVSIQTLDLWMFIKDPEINS